MADLKNETTWHRLLTVTITTLASILVWALLSLIAGYDKSLADLNGYAQKLDADLRALNGTVSRMAVTVSTNTTEITNYKDSGEHFVGDHDIFRQQIRELHTESIAHREKILGIKGRLGVVEQRVVALEKPGGAGKRYTTDDGDRDRGRIIRNEARIDRNDERLDSIESNCCKGKGK